jgi:phage-related protein
MDKWEIIYYLTTSGDNPTLEFLEANPKIKTKVFKIFEYIEKYGLSSVISHVKKLSGTPLWEIRILGQDSTRVLYVTRQEKKIVVLNIFKKKSDKTPLKEIRVALERLKELT